MIKIIRRILSALLVTGIIVNMSTSTVLANSVGESYEKNQEMAKTYILEIVINEQEILQMVNDNGLSYSDAVYYYIIDKMVDYLVENEMSFTVADVDVYTDEEIAADYNGLFVGIIVSIICIYLFMRFNTYSASYNPDYSKSNGEK